MDEQQIKHAEMLCIRSIGRDRTIGTQWWETERKIPTMKARQAISDFMMFVFVIMMLLLGGGAAVILWQYMTGG